MNSSPPPSLPPTVKAWPTTVATAATGEWVPPPADIPFPREWDAWQAWHHGGEYIPSQTAAATSGRGRGGSTK